MWEGGQHDTSCSLGGTRKAIISSQRMFRSLLEKTGMDELPQTGKLNLKYFITVIIFIFNIATLSLVY